MSHFTAIDVAAHQERTLGGVRCTCGGGLSHVNTCPMSLTSMVALPPVLHPKRKLRKLRVPNKTEAEFGQMLEAQKLRGEIVYYGFEEITLRWADMVYTPDYFVIRQTSENHTDMEGVPVFIQAVYIELKGAHRWEDSIIKWKSAKARFTWAEFQLWQKVEGQWNRLG